MSQSASPYPTQASYYSTPPMPNPAFNSDTPPPPPPKPSSHEASRGGTPQTTSSIPPPQPTQPGYTPDPQRTEQSIPHQTSLPPPPSPEEGWLPDIVKDKSTTDLHTILQDPSLITALATHHPSHKTRQTNLTTLIQTNKDLATHLLDLQTHLTTLRTSTEKMLLTHQSIELSWRKKQSEMDAALAPWSPKTLYQRLSAAIAEQEAVCQAVEESFLDGEHGGRATEKEVMEWVRRVRAEAAKLAARKEAKARWDEGRVGGWR